MRSGWPSSRRKPATVPPEVGLLRTPGRDRPLRENDNDRLLHQRAIELCRADDVRLLGSHVSTPQGARRLPDPAEAVA